MSGQADIRKWFLKKPTHDKNSSESKKISAALPNSEGRVVAEKGTKAYQKESKYFSSAGASGNGDKSRLKADNTRTADAGKRKSGEGVTSAGIEEKDSPKKRRLLSSANEDDSDDLEPQPARQTGKRKSSRVDVKDESSPKSGVRGKRNAEEIQESASEVKTPGRGRGRGRGKGKLAGLGRDEDSSSGEDEEADDDTFEVPKSGGRGRGKSPKRTTKEGPTPEKKTPRSGGRATATRKEEDDDKPAAGRGRGRGGGGGGGGPPPWMQPRTAPPHKGEKEVPTGADDALAGLTFVISGTLDSLEREEAEVLVKSHGGRITSAVSKKTSYLLADEDVGGAKSKKAKELGVKFLTEDELFAMILATKPKSENKKQNKSAETKVSPVKSSARAQGAEGQTPQKGASGRAAFGSPLQSRNAEAASSAQKEDLVSKLPEPALGRTINDTDSWTTKHKPKSTTDIIGNPGIVKQLKDWLLNWDATFLHHVSKSGKGKKKAGGSGSSGEKKAVLLSGQPGIGKTTTARLVCEELGFNALEVNASDTRGKADSNIRSGMSGSTANAIKEMVNNLSISFTEGNAPSTKSVLIMDEVDGMSGGDRGGIADLMASIKISKVPIICICNDKYSQKLKSLSNYCLPLPYRKPTKQQMAKRLLVVAKAEGIQVDEVTLEDIAERTNGDMRMSLNQLQYMTLRTRNLKFADVHSRLLASSKDEDISPFSAADKLLGYDSGRLRLDERVTLHMTDMDLVPLIVQENYLNFVPSFANQDQSGMTLMNLASRSATAIADGDVVNVQIRRHQQWQHSQTSAFMSSIIPAALMHGRRMEFEGGRNFNRFPGWLGKNSSFGKKVRLLEDVHIHLLASRACEPTREVIRLGYVPLLAFNLSYPLTHLSKDAAVEQVVKIMDEYSLTQEDYDTIMDICKFKGRPNLLEGVPAAVKTALTRRYKQGDRKVRSADLLPALNLPGQRKGPKKPARLKLTIEEEENGNLDNEESSDEGEADGEEGDDGDGTEKVDSLLELNKSSNKSVDISTAKGKGKQGSSKTPRKAGEGSSSKSGTTPGKRKR